jgi:hypothetical protein
MGFFCSPFLNFLYCVLNFCHHFLLLPWEGSVVFFHFLNYYFIYFK